MAIGILYIVATPIGNLDDISARALTTLKDVGVVYCEDTRVTAKLFDRFSIKPTLFSYHQHSEQNVITRIGDVLASGQSIALVVDAGTPGISDPGGKLVAQIINRFGEEVKVVPIPGASAITTLACVSGLPMDQFLFLGFPPHKKGRNKFFNKITESDYPVVFYESTHRILRSLSEIIEILKKESAEDDQQRWCVAGRELTKQFETIYRGEIREVLEKIKVDSIKGEFVVIVSKWIPQA